MLLSTCGIRSRPDQIEQPEDAGLGRADRTAHDRVRFLDGEAEIERRRDSRLHPIDADAVGDEAGRVLGVDDRLAQHDVAEGGDLLDRLGTRLRSADHFEQAHVARRIEEMRDAEILREAVRQAGGQLRQRNGRGVGRDDRALLPLGVELAIEVLLEVDALDDRLDDPVDIGELPEIVLDIAGRDQLGRSLGHQRRRIGLQQLVDRALGDRRCDRWHPSARCRAAGQARRHWRSGRRCRCPSRRRRRRRLS